MTASSVLYHRVKYGVHLYLLSSCGVGWGGGEWLDQRHGGTSEPLGMPSSIAKLCNCYMRQELLNARRNIDSSKSSCRKKMCR